MKPGVFSLRWRAAALALLFTFFCRTSTPAAELPDGFTEEVLAEKLNAATTMAVAPDGRIFIADQTGPLLVWKDGHLLPTPAIDLSDRLDTFWERGLIGVVLHPDFPHTPHLFVMYVAKAPFPHHVISRFTIIGDRADVASERILLEGDDQSKIGGKIAWGHQGGPMRFGADGKLYIGIGEQTAGAAAQSLNTLQGKILRLNADGSIPEDNPFYTQTPGKYRSVWALGMRNPYGLVVEPDSGRVFETDVGDASFEEVNEIVRGGNYGWPRFEGYSNDPAFQSPLYAYPHAIGRCVVGATICPIAPDASTTAWPQPWQGKLFFADWSDHWIKALDPKTPREVTTFAKSFRAPVAIEFAPDGSLLVLNRGTIWRDGKKWQADTGSLVRIRYAGANAPAAPRNENHSPPSTLTGTGLVAARNPLQPLEGFVEFRINLPPWQPGITARRWISIPAHERLRINNDGQFEFPAGAIVIQHYSLERTGRSFETHILWFTGPLTARAAAYRWNPDCRNAQLVQDGEVIALPDDPKRFWLSPGPEQSLHLDQVVAGFLLPLNLRQLNCADQIPQWRQLGWLDGSWNETVNVSSKLFPLDDDTAPPEVRLRSYLDVNCSACHRPGGPSRGNFDARFTTPLADQKIIHGELVAGDLGIPGAQIIVPGAPEKSVMLQRLLRDDAVRMPPVNVNHEPSPVVPLLEQWIRSLKPAPTPPAK